jgi:2-desacetyl-2-hydroxyethyl bacteriochlorophyllide A dehydrogenase
LSNAKFAEHIYDNIQIFLRKDFDLQYETVKLPSSLQEDEVLIRTLYSLISPGTELALYTGTHVGIHDPNNTFAKYPFYPGYALVGEIVGVGEKVQQFALGDLVYATGKHASYNIMSVNNQAIWPIIKIHNESVLERIPFARLAAISMTSILQSDIRVGDTAVVLGMGIIGNMAAQLFSLMGAEVVAVDVVDERLQVARQMGIQHTILSGESVNVSKKLQEITGHEKADMVIEATGSPKLIVPALDLVKYLGQVLALGSTRGSVDINIYEYIHRKGIRFIGAHDDLQDLDVFISNRFEVTRYILKLIDQKILKIDPLITHKLHYTEAQNGYEMLLNQQSQAIGILLQWD